MKKIITSAVSAVLALCTMTSVCANADFLTDTDYFRTADANNDGIIDAKDATRTLTIYAKSSVGKYQYTVYDENCCEANWDERVDAKDASLILSYYAFTSVGGVSSPDNYFISCMKVTNMDINDKAALITAANSLYTTAKIVGLAYDTCSRFNTSGQPTNGSNGKEYYRISDSRVHSMQDIYNDYMSVFGNYDNFRSSDYATDSNGNIYVGLAARGSALDYQNTYITDIKSISTNKIVFNAQSYYSAIVTGREYTKDADFVIERDRNNVFKVTQFTLPW